MDEGRRRFLQVTVYAGAAAAASAVGAPVGAALLSPLGRTTVREAGEFVEVAALDELRPGEPVRVVIRADRTDGWAVSRAVEVGAAWLVREGESVRAYSTICPHSGCAVDRAEAKGKGAFVCPCHDSHFALDGAPLDGPAKRGLDPLETRVAEGRVELRFARFVLGTADRRPA